VPTSSEGELQPHQDTVGMAIKREKQLEAEVDADKCKALSETKRKQAAWSLEVGTALSEFSLIRKGIWSVDHWCDATLFTSE